jgi:single-strand DNA-binding protein
MTKGTKVTIEGKLRWSQWEKNGEKRSKVEVVVDEVELMARGDKRAAEPAAAHQGGVYDEDIPF